MTSLDGRSPISSPPVLTAIYGDSRTANCFSGNAPDVIMEGYGYAMWAQGFAEGAIRIPPELAFGEGGDTSTMALDRIGPVLSSGARAVFMLLSTNDRGVADMTASQSIENLAKAIKAFRDRRMDPFVVAELPRGGANALAGTQLGYHMQVRDWTKHIAPSLGAIVIDPGADLIDPVSATAAPLPGLFHDELHPGLGAAFYIGRPLGRAARDRYGSVDLLPYSNADQYSASNPRGCLNANPTMQGTGGAKTGVPLPTGEVADGHTLTSTNGTGLTINGSMVQSAFKPVRMQQIAVTGTPTAASPNVYLQNIMTAANIAVGDVVEAFGYVELDAGATNLTGLRLDMRITQTSGTHYTACGDQYAGASYIPGVAFQIPFRTPRFTIGAGFSDARLRFLIQGNQNAPLTATARVAMWARKVP